MKKTVLKTWQDCEDYLLGCTIMGTGGGGDPIAGGKLLAEALDQGLELAWISATDLSDNDWVASAFGLGSIAPPTEERQKEINRLGLHIHPKYSDWPIKELVRIAGAKLSAIVPVELGGLNSVYPLVASARLGLPCVDGDYAGRAVPELVQLTPALSGETFAPIYSEDLLGNLRCIDEKVSPDILEDLCRKISQEGFGVCLMAGLLMRGAAMKASIVPNTLTNCLKLGKAIREARTKGEDPVQALVKGVGGWKVFEGEVHKKEWEDRQGHMYGTTYLKGIGEYIGQTMEIWFKNENHLARKNGKPLIMSPDLIITVDVDSAEPKTNTMIAQGDRLAVIGVKGQQIYRTSKGIEVLGPRHFGFDMDYVPIEAAL
ncbi:MAG: DUF917 domain-containing protein [Candidatus Saganbacteria bacterium]|nr:DUF917 domain-containing protein [Candidatus Saganbacteria bacterium]